MIERIRTYLLEHKLDEPIGFSQWYYSKRNALLIEVVDSSGASGWGECYGPAGVTQTAVEQFYAPILIGQDALLNERLWSMCWHASHDFAMQGVMMGAISGLDMALLDLKGKLLNVSASVLLGGAEHDQLKGYATGMYFTLQEEHALLDSILTEAGEHVAKGFGALKIKVGKNIAFDRMLIEAMRKTFQDQTLMADSNHAYDLNEAIEMGRWLEAHQYRWFEEPLSPTQPAALAMLCEKLDIAVATGECEQTRWGFEKLLHAGAATILQPDMAYCGGPTEALKIRALASAKGVNVIPHCWGTQLNLACAAHFLATTSAEPGRGEPQALMLEVDNSPNPMRTEMYQTSVEIERGRVQVPKGAGLGVEPDLKALQPFCINQTEIMNDADVSNVDRGRSGRFEQTY